jgi:transposase
MAVALTRLELDASDLRREATRCRDAKAARRMLALALVLEGSSREAAARHAGMDRQTLRDWVHRYNAEGLAGLRDRPHPGPTPRLTPEQLSELTRLVEDGPDPEQDGVVRWRQVDLQAVIAKRFGVRLHERRDRQGAAPARLRPPLGAPAAPAQRPRGAGRVQKTYVDGPRWSTEPFDGDDRSCAMIGEAEAAAPCSTPRGERASTGRDAPCPDPTVTPRRAERVNTAAPRRERGHAQARPCTAGPSMASTPLLTRSSTVASVLARRRRVLALASARPNHAGKSPIRCALMSGLLRGGRRWPSWVRAGVPGTNLPRRARSTSFFPVSPELS